METTETKLETWGDKSPTIGAIAAALAKAQASIGKVAKESANPFFKSKYADLSAVREAMREPFAQNGLVALQEASTHDGKVRVTTTILHTSGEYIRSSLDLTPVKNDPQAIGSAITYGRRYALQSVAGIAPEDDDGNAASGQNDKRPAAPAPRRELPASKPTPMAAPKATVYRYDLSTLADKTREKYGQKLLEKGANQVELHVYDIAEDIDALSGCKVAITNKEAA